MTRTCSTCGRSWGGDAAFCGACGDLLDASLGDRTGGPGGGRSNRWRRPAVAGAVTVAAVVGVVAAVPTFSIQGPPPVDGEIGVPAADDLRAPPRDTRARQEVDPPRVACSRPDGSSTDCVLWARAVAPSALHEPSSSTSWVMARGNRLVVVTDDHLTGMDTATGTRLWRRDREVATFPMGIGEEVLVVGDEQSVDVVDLDDGTVRWQVRTGDGAVGSMGGPAQLVGAAPGAELVYTGLPEATTGVVARDPADGTVRWVWRSSRSGAVHVRALAGGRLLATVNGGGSGLAVLDARDGDELYVLDRRIGQWILDVVGDVAVAVEQPARTSPNRGGDPGATLRGVDLTSGDVLWEQPLRVSDGGFLSAAGLVVAPSADRVTAIDMRTGAIAWDVPSDGLEQVADDGRWSLSGTVGEPADLVVTTVPGARTARARDPATGRVVWERQLDAPIHYALADRTEVVLMTTAGPRVLDPDTGDDRLAIETGSAGLVQRDPLLLFDHMSGYVLRLAAP